VIDGLEERLKAAEYAARVNYPDGYRDAWLEMIAHCNEVKADRFRLEQTIRSDFHEVDQQLRDRIARLTLALNDIASSSPIPTPHEGWEFCRDVARNVLSEAAEQDALAISSPIGNDQ
jgi:hypothetical protein